MEPKKNAKYDIHRRRALLLNAGLAISLVIMICAFEWTVDSTPREIILERYEATDLTLLDYPQPTTFKKLEAPKPKPVISARPVAGINVIESDDNSVEESPDPQIDIESPEPFTGPGLDELPKETLPPDTFITVENMPEPVGGWQTFFNTLSKNIKYPKKAERLGASGKVFVQFTVNHLGEPSHFHIIKGVGHGCDEEAVRVLAMTKWKPGKQRGRAVNVRMVQPINFAIRK